MLPDPQRVADTRSWLSRARIDLRAAEHERTAQPPLTADIVFHAQQLAEKALKALLTWHDEPFRKTRTTSSRSVANARRSILLWSHCSAARHR